MAKDVNIIVLTLTTGRLTLALLLITLVASTASFLPFKEAKAAPVELYYDDGSPDFGWSALQGIEHAVRFSLQPSWCSAQILTVRYHIWGTPSTFRVHVYDEDGTTDLTTPFDVTPGGTGWFDVDLTARNIVVTGDFFIVIEFLSSARPTIGVDDTSPIDLRTYSREAPGKQWEVADNIDQMIRAAVEPVECAPVGGTVIPVHKLEILAPYIALAGLIAVVSVVYVIKKRKD